MCALEKESKTKKCLEASLEECTNEIKDLKTKLNTELKTKVALYKTIEKLKIDSEVTKEHTIEVKSTEIMESLEFYKKLADDHMKECKSLAEQLICLRSDMDHSTTQMIKVKMEMSSAEINSKSVQKEDRKIFKACNTLQQETNKILLTNPTSPSRNVMVEISNKATDVKLPSEFLTKALVKTPPNCPYITTYKSNFNNFQMSENAN